MGRDNVLIFHEDNTAMIQVCKTGNNPTLRHLGRTHRVDVHWLHERFSEDCYKLIYEETRAMRAGILTKGFLDTEKWRHALMLINHTHPKTFWKFNSKEEIITIKSTDALAEVATPAGIAPKLAKHVSGDVFPLPKKDRRRIHRLVSTVALPKGGRVNDSSTSFFGARSDTSGTRVTKFTAQEADLTKTINQMLSTATHEKGTRVDHVADRGRNDRASPWECQRNRDVHLISARKERRDG